MWISHPSDDVLLDPGTEGRGHAQGPVPRAVSGRTSRHGRQAQILRWFKGVDRQL